MSDLRLGVLASGGGTNLQAILDACSSEAFPAEVAVVICNRPGAGALKRSQDAGVATCLLDHTQFDSREAFDTGVLEVLRQHEVELVCLAGFMRLVSDVLLDAYPQRVLNIHPSLLPAFPGLAGPRQAVEYGVRFSGATVHFVDAGTDTGSILIQSLVPVHADDTEQSLGQRILATEHRIYPAAIRAISEGRVKFDGRRVIVSESQAPESALFNPDIPV